VVGSSTTNRRLVGAAGILVAVPFSVGNSLWAFDAPDPGAPAAELLRFYDDKAGGIIAGASISLVAVALFVYFAAGFRALLARLDRDDVLANTAFGGALLGAAAGLAAETINMAAAMRADDGNLTPSFARSAFEISQVLGFNAAGVGIGTFAIAAAAAALRTRSIMPAWLAVLTIAVGLALMTPLSRDVFHIAVVLLAVIAVFVIRAPDPDPAA
jgi:hypothetical protein